MKVLKKVAVAALGVAAVGGAMLIAPAAQAATAGNGKCEAGEVCLYYNSNQQGSLRDFNGSVKTYGTGSSCLKFVSAGNGRGKCVKNNAASVSNRMSVPVTVFYKSNYAGAIDSFTAGTKGNLRAGLKNENAGHLVGKSGNTAMENVLYKTSSGAISAYFDGYLSQSGRHEGIDFTRGSGVPVYSVLSGKVISKVEGSTNSLSTISIYNSSLNTSIIYLHTDPQVSVGQNISKGQKIAVEDNRAGGAAHTHVEMRPGRQTHASKSVDDPVLNNPIPTSFWMARGYNICCQ